MDRSKMIQTGFTLIELMITLVIAIVVLSIGIPGISRLKQNSELTTVTNELVAMLNLGRSEAIKRTADVTVQVFPLERIEDTIWYNRWDIRVTGSELVRVSEKHLNRFTDPSVSVTFDALGNTDADACFDVKTSGSRTMPSISMLRTGRIATCKCDIPTGQSSASWSCCSNLNLCE